MQPAEHIMEELKRIDAKGAMIFSALVSLVAVTVAIIGLGHVPTVARIMIAVSQIVFISAMYPVLLAIAPKGLGKTRHGLIPIDAPFFRIFSVDRKDNRNENDSLFGLMAWSAGVEDNSELRRMMLARRAIQGYRHLKNAIVIMMVGLTMLVAAGVATAVAS